VLLSVTRIFAKRYTDHAVAILPGMRLGAGDGIRIVNHTSKYETRLNGSLDYCVLQYPVEHASNKDCWE